MMKRSWTYNEFEQVGKDYSQEKEVAVYDSTHSDFRDVTAENNAILNRLGLKKEHTIIDFGSGTGAFAIQAASYCKKVFAIDVSQTMLDFSKKKTKSAEVENIEFHHAGYLSYDHKEGPVDAIVSSFSFHHLPDYWKSVALRRMHEMLNPDGKFYLYDVIIEEENAEENIQAFIESQAALGGDFLREDAEEHFREEYSTFDWIMEALLQRSGFTILEKEFSAGVLGTYLCSKKNSS
ncbi:MAG: class I SAM-dependent methyltransferase [Balneolaceae bacterium]|nr:class I SAM-dependent methyltransferase [Balneolaceae bacterium]